MYRFFIGFATGVYVGTLYDCKPIIDKIIDLIEEHSPKSK